MISKWRQEPEAPCFWLNQVELDGKTQDWMSLLQPHSSKVSIDWCSAIFIVQHSHPHMTTEKTVALTRQNFVSKVMSLLFNMLSRLVTAFLPRSKLLLIPWLGSSSAVILEPPPPTIKSVTVSIFPHLFAMKWWYWMPWSLFFECWALSQLFHSPLSFSSRGSLVLLHFLP